MGTSDQQSVYRRRRLLAYTILVQYSAVVNFKSCSSRAGDQGAYSALLLRPTHLSDKLQNL